jgi:hypothetical protein
MKVQWQVTRRRHFTARTAPFEFDAFEFDAKGSAREIRELVPLSPVALTDLKNEVSFMTANNVTPFEVFKSFVEFYPNLGATIAFGTMATAARMIPNSGAAISDAPQAEGPELVSPVNMSTPRKRSSIPRKRSTVQQPSARKRSTPLKTRRKASKRATGRRKAA